MNISNDKCEVNYIIAQHHAGPNKVMYSFTLMYTIYLKSLFTGLLWVNIHPCKLMHSRLIIFIFDHICQLKWNGLNGHWL